MNAMQHAHVDAGWPASCVGFWYVVIFQTLKPTGFFPNIVYPMVFFSSKKQWNTLRALLFDQVPIHQRTLRALLFDLQY